MRSNRNRRIERITPENITRLETNQVFVYGSNLAGVHGAGAARSAHRSFGATWGRCHGLDNNTYGIPTKDANLKVLPLDRIKKYVDNFVNDCKINVDRQFFVTAVGTGLAGYTPKDIAPLFEQARDLKNIYLPQEFWEVLDEKEIE